MWATNWLSVARAATSGYTSVKKKYGIPTRFGRLPNIMQFVCCSTVTAEYADTRRESTTKLLVRFLRLQITQRYVHEAIAASC